MSNKIVPYRHFLNLSRTPFPATHGYTYFSIVLCTGTEGAHAFFCPGSLLFLDFNWSTLNLKKSYADKAYYKIFTNAMPETRITYKHKNLVFLFPCMFHHYTLLHSAENWKGACSRTVPGNWRLVSSFYFDASYNCFPTGGDGAKISF